MANRDHNDQQDAVILCVDDSVIANPKSIACTSTQRPRRRRTGILCKEGDCTLYPGLDRAINLA
jgi:hypothetical protein